MGKNPFKVIIAGESIAGLTLSHCLDRGGIDYVILGRRAEVAPQVGASLGIMPNGARIPQQLGLYAPLSEDYKTGVCLDMLNVLEDMDGKQVGDPVVAAERIWEVVIGGMAREKGVGLRLPLG